jgi:hypothetical protein
MPPAERKSARIAGLLFLLLPALNMVGMTLDGRIEWQLQRDNPVGNMVSLAMMAVLTVAGLALILFPGLFNAAVQRRIFGGALLLFALESITGLLRRDFIDGPADVLFVVAIVLTLGWAGLSGALGVKLIRKREAKA